MRQLQHGRAQPAFALMTGLVLSATAALASEDLQQAPLGATQEVEVFVRLSTPAVAEINARSIAATERPVSVEEQRAQAARIDAEQASFRPRLQALGAQELSHMRVGANGIRMLVNAGQVEALKQLPGVTSVGRVTVHELDNADSVPWVGALAVAESLAVRGEGIRIGVIDSGVDYLHANFGGAGTVAAYAANNKNVIEPGTFPTAKVVGGYDFAGPLHNPGGGIFTTLPDPDPLDGNGHGSHVAGSATGIGVPGLIHPGVAPAAKLYAIKVFNDTAGNTSVASLGVEFALDPNGDGDMSDHLDVLNLSLGSVYGEEGDPFSIALDNAVANGIIVVTSAGNSGNLPYVAGSPGIAPSAISTAANVPGGRIHARATVTAPAAVAGVKFNEEANATPRIATVGPISDTVVRADPIAGCTPFVNAVEVSGNIVLIQRGGPAGGCAFALKLANAQAAGARAVVLFNNVAGDPIVAGTVGVVATIPMLMVSLADGSAMAAAATTTSASPLLMTLDTGLDPTKDDRMVSFSSRGPTFGTSGFKPDISAPGIGIISTGVGQGNGPAPNQGTSMSAPFVTGSAALLRQLHPDLPVSAIKALLLNSTADANPSGDRSLARTGVGALRVNRAATLTSYASPGGISFGRLNPASTINANETVYLTNMSNRPRTYNVTHVPRGTYPGVTVTCPQTVTIGRYGTKPFNVRLRFDPRVAPTEGVFDNASISQREIDGWCILNDGTDTLRVGYLGVVDAASKMQLAEGDNHVGLRIANKGPAIGFAEGFTLVGTGGAGAENTYSSIAHLGVRRGDPARFGGDRVIEFGLAMDRTFTHPYQLDVDLFLDLDRNGTDDVRLRGRDWTKVQASPPAVLGTYITTQQALPAGAGILDWAVSSWDFNDRVIILPFSMAGSGGLVPDSFNYRLEVVDGTGNRDVQTGSVNLAAEIVPDLNSFGLERGDSVDIGVSGGEGRMLWLFPNDHDWVQDWTIRAAPGGAH